MVPESNGFSPGYPGSFFLMPSSVELAGRLVGAGQPTFVIAEVGSNHDRDLSQAKRLIDVAVEAGADAVKFQLYSAADLCPPDSPAFEAVAATELPVEWVPELANLVSSAGLQFAASPFSSSAVDQLVSVGAPWIKIASSEVMNLPLLRYAAATQKPLLLSSGMCDLSALNDAIHVVHGQGNDQVVLMQCTSLYPTPPEHVHLRGMDALRTAFDVPVGFSDHSLGTHIPVAAAALGACVVEKHLTLSRELEGPDHGYALEPAEFSSMVEEIRAVDLALGSHVKRFLPEEAILARRSSLRAAVDIRVGAVITDQCVAVVGRAGGVAPRFNALVIGCRAKVSIPEGDAITWENIDYE
jgi:sialic acid synthase SpsE